MRDRSGREGTRTLPVAMHEESGREREDDGAYSSECSGEDFLRGVRERHRVTTGQVAGGVGRHRWTAPGLLRALADRGGGSERISWYDHGLGGS